MVPWTRSKEKARRLVEEFLAQADAQNRPVQDQVQQQGQAQLQDQGQQDAQEQQQNQENNQNQARAQRALVSPHVAWNSPPRRRRHNVNQNMSRRRPSPPPEEEESDIEPETPPTPRAPQQEREPKMCEECSRLAGIIRFMNPDRLTELHMRAVERGLRVMLPPELQPPPRCRTCHQARDLMRIINSAHRQGQRRPLRDQGGAHGAQARGARAQRGQSRGARGRRVSGQSRAWAQTVDEAPAQPQAQGVQLNAAHGSDEAPGAQANLSHQLQGSRARVNQLQRAQRQRAQVQLQNRQAQERRDFSPPSASRTTSSASSNGSSTLSSSARGSPHVPPAQNIHFLPQSPVRIDPLPPTDNRTADGRGLQTGGGANESPLNRIVVFFDPSLLSENHFVTLEEACALIRSTGLHNFTIESVKPSKLPVRKLSENIWTFLVELHPGNDVINESMNYEWSTEGHAAFTLHPTNANNANFAFSLEILRILKRRRNENDFKIVNKQFCYKDNQGVWISKSVKWVLETFKEEAKEALLKLTTHSRYHVSKIHTNL